MKRGLKTPFFIRCNFIIILDALEAASRLDRKPIKPIMNVRVCK